MPTDSRDPDPGRWDLTVESPAKLNLGLAVLGRRPDGFHDILTLFQAIDLSDTLRVRGRREGGIRLSVEGMPGLSTGGDNLVVRALEAISRRCGKPLHIEALLRKQIPAGAGLGGGSGNAAAALIAGARLGGWSPEPGELEALAAELGSDVPFFLMGGLALGEGRGERLSPLGSGPSWRWLLALPVFRIGTKAAYSKAHKGLTQSITRLNMLQTALGEENRALAMKSFANDLEAAALALEPRLSEVRAGLLGLGLEGVTMTGSGSAFFSLLPTSGGGAPRLPRADELRLEESDFIRVPHLEWAQVCRSVPHGVRVVHGSE